MADTKEARKRVVCFLEFRKMIEICFFFSLFYPNLFDPFEISSLHKSNPIRAVIREDAYSRTGGIFIRDTARHTAYSL